MHTNRPANIFVIIITTYLLATILLPFEPAHAKLGKDQHFTVQACSNTSLMYAEKNFYKLKANMPEQMLSYLRIEYIATYYALRIGKLHEWHDVVTLLDHTKKYFPEAYILEAYIKKENIKKIYGQVNEEEIKPSADIQQYQEEQLPPEAISGLPQKLADSANKELKEKIIKPDKIKEKTTVNKDMSGSQPIERKSDTHLNIQENMKVKDAEVLPTIKHRENSYGKLFIFVFIIIVVFLYFLKRIFYY